MLLGCIADDFTGATDLANTLSRQGMHTVQTIGIPKAFVDADAVVVALKSRTIPAADAVEQSLAACRWLKGQGAEQIYFKYCSTFDSTDQGNIGPVADALMDELDADVTTICPAFPENGRTIYLGHLFVGNVLLSDSSMRHHPLTPMTDSNLVSVMARQSRCPVGLIEHKTVSKGAAAIARALNSARGHFVVDALQNDDLLALGEACASLKLVTGGSGAALGLPANFIKTGKLAAYHTAKPLPPLGGKVVVLSGSCSAATNQQVSVFKASHRAYALNLARLFADPASEIATAVSWASEQEGAALIFSTASADDVAAVQTRHGREHAGAVIEQALGEVASRLAAKGIRRFVVAGGETSGAVTKSLRVEALEIGPQIAPGVPVTQSLCTPRYGLVLKSGNFGGPDFFADAIKAMP